MALGLTPFLQQQFLATLSELPSALEFVPERVTKVERGEYSLLGPHGARRAVLAGRLLEADDESRPCIGDFVIALPGPPGDLTRIERVLPRSSLFSRKVVGESSRRQAILANVDLAIAVAAFPGQEADQHVLRRGLNPRRLERYLHAAREAPASALIVINKADLRSDAEELARELSGELGHSDVLLVSANTGLGIAELRSRIQPGTTAVLIGSSGVGKSSLTNRLLGNDTQRVVAMRDEDARGRHTTTQRELWLLPGGGLLVDTPGMREFALASGDTLTANSTGFAEIDALAGECRFRDCRHEGEPGCAVRAAVARGEVDEERLRHAHKLEREALYQKMRTDVHTRLAEKQRFKARTRGSREAQRRKGER
jgi:ribosome biogenesis GTPase / thiamine phosphate phosphatase